MNFEKPPPELLAWREFVRADGSILSGRHPVEIHHPIGRTAKVKSVGNVGHVFILPLTREEHLWCDWGKEGLRLMKQQYGLGNGYDDADHIINLGFMEFQKYLFDKVCQKIGPPCTEDVIDAIQDWHR